MSKLRTLIGLGLFGIMLATAVPTYAAPQNGKKGSKKSSKKKGGKKSSKKGGSKSAKKAGA
jgi:hypothetical protein